MDQKTHRIWNGPRNIQVQVCCGNFKRDLWIKRWIWAALSKYWEIELRLQYQNHGKWSAEHLHKLQAHLWFSLRQRINGGNADTGQFLERKTGGSLFWVSKDHRDSQSVSWNISGVAFSRDGGFKRICATSMRWTHTEKTVFRQSVLSNILRGRWTFFF